MLSNDKLHEVVRTGILLTTEKDKNKLLDQILTRAMEISECDAGTLYLYKDNTLEFKVMKTTSMGINKGSKGEKIDLPPVPFREENICAYSAIHRKLINIADVYFSDEFDFTGPRKYDSMTGYRTGSMLVTPMTNMEGEIVGVLQLMNAGGDNKTSVPFSEDMELMIEAIGSQAGVAIANMAYTDEIRMQMHSFVEAFTTAVDERTPYNATHTRKVADYSIKLAQYINEKNASGLTGEFFDDRRLEQLQLSAMLHDVGKMIVPLEVMNKPTRLGDKLDIVLNRLEHFKVCYQRDMLMGKISEADYESEIKYLDELATFIKENDKAGFMPDDKMEFAKAAAEKKYVSDDTATPYLTEYEAECLCIRRGTLTDAEREAMQSHAVMTGKILEKVHLRSNYSKVKHFAESHHEFLDGSGYPAGLKSDELETEIRIMTIADIYDALTCTDRPYKVPMPQEKAFAIITDMADKGQLDSTLVEWFKECV